MRKNSKKRIASKADIVNQRERPDTVNQRVAHVVSIDRVGEIAAAGNMAAPTTQHHVWQARHTVAMVATTTTTVTAAKRYYTSCSTEHSNREHRERVY